MTAPLGPALVHRHECVAARFGDICEGPCICECGAVLSMGPTYEKDGRWAWLMPDGTFEEWT